MKRLTSFFTIIALILAVFTLSGCTTTPKETPSPAEETLAEGTTQEEEELTEQAEEEEATEEADHVSELEGSEWIVETIQGNAAVTTEGPPTLEFLANGRLAGNASCNRMLGTYEEGNAPGELILNLAGTTMRMCPDDIMKQEQDFMALLPEINGYEIEGDVLHLKSRGEVVVVARRA